MEWRVLIVDDRHADDVNDVIKERKVVSSPDSISCVLCDKFSKAMSLLKNERFDLVILDLKDDEAQEQEIYAGEAVFEAIKKCRFVPVIFHTGFPYKVQDLASPYVKVVARSEWSILRSTIREIFDTKLPRLVRHIEEEQRRFMWESAEKIWAEDLEKKNSSDLVYLLARRLANLLSNDVVRSFLESDVDGGSPKSDKTHAVELYVFPPLSKHFRFGDIFINKTNDEMCEYFVALTPSCDHAQGKADFVLLARCKHLKETPEWSNVKGYLDAKNVPSKTAMSNLKELMSDNSRPQDRYKYLPGTSFIPDLLVDMQNTLIVDRSQLISGEAAYERIASLDSPFAESLQAKMSRYFGRIGTPDLDSDLAFERFKEQHIAPS